MPRKAGEGTLVLAASGSAEHQQQLIAGKHYRFEARSQAIGSNLDLQIELLDAEGNSLVKNDDANPATVDALIRFTPKEDMVVTGIVKGYSNGGLDRRYEGLQAKKFRVFPYRLAKP